MNWMPRRQAPREHHKCEGHEGCLFWAYARARRTATSVWHWYCPQCLKSIRTCGWEVDVPCPRTDAEKSQGDLT